MINDGVNVISNSWAYCEDQTTPADVQSIDSILTSAGAAGITVLSGSGDMTINVGRFTNATLPALQNFKARLVFNQDTLTLERFGGELAGG